MIQITFMSTKKRSIITHPHKVSASATNKNQTKYALLSVSDKTGLVELAQQLQSLGFSLISTGGTSKVLTNANISTIPIQEITGNPESFDGRMKTISFQVEGGILYDRKNMHHRSQAKELGIKDISLVICNLYPFETIVKNPDISLKEVIESIDVGGPTMVRSAAKNFHNVLVVVDPKDYQVVAEEYKKNSISIKFRQKLAAKAFDHLSFYDAQIAQYLRDDQEPEEITMPGRKSFNLRYGENPHQKASVYLEPNTNSPLAHLQRMAGRELSYVNFTDIAAGLESVRIFKQPAAVVIKHNSPSGIALGSTASESLKRAVAADPESAFGGVIVLNKPLDISTARTFASFKEENGVLIDIVAAPSITPQAEAFIKTVRKSTGIYIFGEIPIKRSSANHLRFFDGGFLLQEWDDSSPVDWRIVTSVKPTLSQMNQIKLSWKFIGRIRSNSILILDKKLPMTRGIGSGQTSRIRATRIALEQASTYSKGGILASDSFFPFDDSVKLAAKYKIAAIVQQGGSINDKASIDAANAAGIPMVMTGQRKFWH